MQTPTRFNLATSYYTPTTSTTSPSTPAERRPHPSAQPPPSSSSPQPTNKAQFAVTGSSHCNSGSDMQDSIMSYDESTALEHETRNRQLQRIQKTVEQLMRKTPGSSHRSHPRSSTAPPASAAPAAGPFSSPHRPGGGGRRSTREREALAAYHHHHYHHLGDGDLSTGSLSLSHSLDALVEGASRRASRTNQAAAAAADPVESHLASLESVIHSAMDHLGGGSSRQNQQLDGQRNSVRSQSPPPQQSTLRHQSPQRHADSGKEFRVQSPTHSRSQPAHSSTSFHSHKSLTEPISDGGGANLHWPPLANQLRSTSPPPARDDCYSQPLQQQHKPSRAPGGTSLYPGHALALTQLHRPASAGSGLSLQRPAASATSGSTPSRYLPGTPAGATVPYSSPFSPSGGGAGSGGGGSFDPTSLPGDDVHALRHALMAERIEREASRLEEERMREWIHEMRQERRRLEDRVLEGSVSGARSQELRDSLERQVQQLLRQRDVCEMEAQALNHTREQVGQLEQQCQALHDDLLEEQKQNEDHRTLQSQLEDRLSEVSSQLPSVREQQRQQLASLQQDRDTLALKLKKAQQQGSCLEEDVQALKVSLQQARDEVSQRDASLQEVRASAEALHNADKQFTGQLASANGELAARVEELTRQLDTTQHELHATRLQLGGSQAETQKLVGQLEARGAKVESLRGERDKLVAALQGEQVAAATLRQSLEKLQVQLRSAEVAAEEAAKAAVLQATAVQRQHESQLAGLQKQCDLQLSSAERSGHQLEKQLTSSAAAHDKLAALHETLRKERDELSNESSRLRGELEAAVRDKHELSGKLTVLRSQVKHTIEDVTTDREARLRQLLAQHDKETQDLRQSYEAKVAQVSNECDRRLEGMLELSERLQAELATSRRTNDKYRGTLEGLKGELHSVLLKRDGLERELEAERSFNEELNRVISAIQRVGRETLPTTMLH